MRNECGPPAAGVAMRPNQRYYHLHDGNAKGENQGEMSKFYKHGV